MQLEHHSFFSGSVGQIFYSQGIAVITGPDSGSLREFAHNVGYKNNMNPNINVIFIIIFIFNYNR